MLNFGGVFKSFPSATTINLPAIHPWVHACPGRVLLPGSWAFTKYSATWNTRHPGFLRENDTPKRPQNRWQLDTLADIPRILRVDFLRSRGAKWMGKSTMKQRRSVFAHHPLEGAGLFNLCWGVFHVFFWENHR